VKAASLRIAGLAASLVIVLWGAATVAFLAFRLIPGDPVSVMLGPQAQVSEAVKDGIRAPEDDDEGCGEARDAE
jgi:peptide/nickel transport system permease protein